MANLYAGNILIVDLGKGKITKEPTRKYSDSFLGGRGINIKLFTDHIQKGVDPLGPKNVIVFGVGPLGGTTLSSARTEVTAKSPETGLLGASNFGGFWGSELKYAGYDHLVIKGKAEKPVYIFINNDQVEIRDAEPYWGKDSYDSQDLIRRDLDNPDVQIACIGQAGENLVRFATIQHNLGDAAGRTGMGTVMGSKNLKAIVVRGTNQITVADPETLLEHHAKIAENIKNLPEILQIKERGLAPLQNEFAQLDWIKSAAKVKVGGKMPSMLNVYNSHPSKRTGCQGCPIQCMEQYQVDGVGKGTISCELYPSWSVQVGCYNPDTSLDCAILCQRYGIDCVSASEIIHWLMDLYEKGIIGEKDTDNIPMEWGSDTAIRYMLDKIVFREGIGDVFAEGILPAAKKIGRDSVDHANQQRGLPMIEGHCPEYLPATKGAALSLVVSSRGDSMRGMSPVGVEAIITPEIAEAITGTKKAADASSYEGKPALAKFTEDADILCDILSMCKLQSPWTWWVYNMENQADLLSAGSGKEISVEMLLESANKARTLERMYELQEGYTREKQTLPDSFFKPIENGPFKGINIDPEKFEEMKTIYYELRGWDPTTGIPTEETLKRYGLDGAA